jgi:uncharacterized protein (TIGR02996 family)
MGRAVTDAELLLKAIIAQPEADLPRLCYADEIEATQPHRAEFIRVQCALARYIDMSLEPARSLRRRQGELLDAHRKEWFPLLCRTPGFGEDEPLRWWPIADGLPKGTPLLTNRIDGTPRRGFLDGVTLDARDWLAHGDAIRAAHPVTHVRLTTWPHSVESEFNRSRYPLFLENRWPGVAFELPPVRRGIVGRLSIFEDHTGGDFAAMREFGARLAMEREQAAHVSQQQFNALVGGILERHIIDEGLLPDGDDEPEEEADEEDDATPPTGSAPASTGN